MKTAEEMTQATISHIQRLEIEKARRAANHFLNNMPIKEQEIDEDVKESEAIKGREHGLRHYNSQAVNILSLSGDNITINIKAYSDLAIKSYKSKVLREINSLIKEYTPSSKQTAQLGETITRSGKVNFVAGLESAKEILEREDK